MNAALWLITYRPIIIGISLTIFTLLGTLYLAEAYLDKEGRFLKFLTQSLTFAVMCGIVVGIGTILIGFTIIILALLYSSNIPRPYSNVHLIITQKNVFLRLFILLEILFPLAAAIFGTIFGFPIGILRSLVQKLAPFSDKLSLRIFSVWVSISCALILLSLLLFSSSSSFLLSLLAGFIVGTLPARIKFSRKKFIFCLIIISLCATSLIILLKLLLAPTLNGIYNANILRFLDLEAVFLLGLILGLTGNLPQRIDSSFEKVSWKHVALWFLIGFVYTYIIALELTLLSFLSFEIAIIIGAAIGIAGGKGGNLIKNIKPKYRFDIKLNKSIPLVNWKIGAFSILLATVYAFYLQIVGYALFPFLPYSHVSAPNRLQDLANLGVLLANFYLTIAIGVILGSIVGSIHTFERVVTFKIENLSHRRLGQIGLGLSLVGILVSALSSFIK